MASTPLHFVFFPLMAQGHFLPMVDIAKLLAQRGIISTIFVTPEQAIRIQKVITRAKNSGLRIQLVLLHSLNEEDESQEFHSLDQVPSSDLIPSFFSSLSRFQRSAEEQFADLNPKPDCIISDSTLPWTLEIATKFEIPWITFSGSSCFCPVVSHKTHTSHIHAAAASDDEYFTVPDLPDKIELTRAQLPTSQVPDLIKLFQQMGAAEMRAFGKIVNSFEELEPAYVEDCKKMNRRIWCIGPVSLCNKNTMDKAERGGGDGGDSLKWLDTQKPSSVLYVCLGSMSNLKLPQLVELGLGLEASNKPFIWVIRTEFQEFENWVKEEGYEERIKPRGLLIRGWAPQVLILSHSAVGGFVTHCGWNSILEAISGGVPMVTWPLFSEQFVNEKQVVSSLKIGLKIGAERPVKMGQEETGGVQVRREMVREAIEELMGEGDEAERRRRKVRDLSEMAKIAVEDGGSSQRNVTMLIDEILKARVCDRRSN